MNLKIMTAENKDAGSVSLPVQFSEAVREDLISRSVFALQAAKRQPYGSSEEVGKRHSSKLSRRRRDYRGSYGKGISRVPRKIHNRRGMQMSWVGALSPGTVGGRRAHPPKPYADYQQKVNTTENRKAIRSALSATMDKELVIKRGHKVPNIFPFIIDNSFEAIAKTADLMDALTALGFTAELDRAGVTRIRAGRGKTRGRKYKSPTSILFVTSKDSTPLCSAAANLPGSDVVAVHRVNAELLAPGCHPGRLTLYTKAAIERLASEALFTAKYKGESTRKPKAPLVEKPAKVARVAKAAKPATEAKPATKKVAKK